MRKLLSLIILLSLLLLPPVAWGAISEVASRRASVVQGWLIDSALPLAFPGNVTSGNLLVAMGAVWTDTAPSAPSVTSTRTTGAWSIYYYWHTVAADTYYLSFIAIAKATSTGACTVTVNAGTTGYTTWGYSIDEFTGQDLTTPLRTDGSYTLVNSAAPSVALTSTIGDLILGVMVAESGTTTALTPGTGFTQIGENQNNNDYQAYNAEFQITTGTSPNVTWTLASAQDLNIYRIAIKPAAGGSSIKTVLGVAKASVKTVNGLAIGSVKSVMGLQ